MFCLTRFLGIGWYFVPFYTIWNDYVQTRFNLAYAETYHIYLSTGNAAFVLHVQRTYVVTLSLAISNMVSQETAIVYTCIILI